MPTICPIMSIPVLGLIVSIISVAVITYWNWKSVVLKRSEYCYEASRRLITSLDAEFFSPYSDKVFPHNHLGVKSIILSKVTLQFKELHSIIKGVKDKYLLSSLEVDRLQGVINLKKLLKLLQVEAPALHPNQYIDELRLMVMFAFAPNITTACSHRPLNHEIQKKAIRELLSEPNVSKLSEVFWKEVFSKKMVCK